MSSSRRDRSKREGTFLEQVKNWMQFLSTEISEIKSTISELKVAQEDSTMYRFRAQDVCSFHFPDVDQLVYNNDWYNLDDTGYSYFENAACPITEDTLLSYLKPSAKRSRIALPCVA